MSYLVLARKYRPKTFSEMVGQEHVVQALSNALTQQRLHHAYLFTGTRGVGKTTVSRILAKSLNCQGIDGQGGITATPCGVCPACMDIDSGRFPDYTELDAASNRGVDEVQGLLEQAVYKPVQGRFKVFMIDEVHMLTNTAFNAMLKTLEEPPEYLKFVLATTDPQKVPVTVLSRCLQFNLRPMAPETVLEHLTKVLGEEQVQADQGALRLLSRAARGSMRDALSLTDQAIAFGSGKLEEAGVRQMLGSVDRTYVFRLIDALARADGRTVVETVDELRTNGLSAASTLEEMSTVLQRMAVLQAVPNMAASIDQHDAEAQEMARLAMAMPADETQLLYSMCLHGRAELGLAPDEYAALTMVLLRLLAFKKPSDGASQGTASTAGNPAEAEKKTLTQAETAPAVEQRQAPQAVSRPRDRPPEAPVAPVQAPAVIDVEPERTASRQASGEPEPAYLSAPAPHDEQPTQRAPYPQPPSQNHSAMRLPVRTPEEIAHPPVEMHDGHMPALEADTFDIPVRHAPEPGMRTQPNSLQGGAAAQRLVPTAEGEVWYQTVQEMAAAGSIQALVRELALQSQLIARDQDHWLLRVERESLNQPAAREKLRAALEAAGHTKQISVEVGKVMDSPSRRNAYATAQRQKLAEDIVQSDPRVQQLIRDFGAKIVPGSIRPA
ncbi:DNA polymerase III subunit gamma/tau [Diaphorobacter sp. HDW4A]|uniref:DNA polymerase III subunit gamma/tau n=1 Tax=Diaphorobacter sp. HDW4A TaxID=2714924 RepID=UPI00140E8A37|nr:DNA polymerase III subunit gamma/tau [Diaphorobacter sp. HDW4A]QIL79745.1 DNA polymerase III subunit gamma/tau [Diaphorobacter sp. HDW4A]